MSLGEGDRPESASSESLSYRHEADDEVFPERASQIHGGVFTSFAGW